jgi:hypothetical protein
MLAQADNRFGPTPNEHSIANRLAMNIPNPGFDENPLIQTMKANLESGFQGYGKGISGLFDGTGILGGLFASSDFSTWGVGEYVCIGVGLYALISMFHTTRSAKRGISSSIESSRKRRASELRERADRLEGKSRGSGGSKRKPALAF